MSNKRWSPPAEHVCVFLTDSDNEILQSICPDASAARKQAFKKKKKKAITNTGEDPWTWLVRQRYR